MCARVAGRPTFKDTTQTVLPGEIFSLGLIFDGAISFEEWGQPLRPARSFDEPLYYDALAVAVPSPDYAQANVQALPKMSYARLKTSIKQIYSERPSCDIGYSYLMDAFPSADLEDIVKICDKLEEEGIIGAVEGT